MARTFALDVHKRFSEVALNEDGEIKRVGRIETKDLDAFAASLGKDDRVVLESTAVSWAIIDKLAAHVGQVTLSNPARTKAISEAKVKTDKVDARTLAELGAAGMLASVWVPDQETRALRRRIAHRAALVRQRTQVKNRVHGLLARNLVEVPATDAFGKKGRRFLEALQLASHERASLDSLLRLYDAVQTEVDLVEGEQAGQALASQEAKRLLTIPGVGTNTALALVGVIGDIGRFDSASRLVGYLGLDPKVRQSGDSPQRGGHISRAGQAHARAMLVEAAHVAVRTPGPLRGFYLRLKARRGAHIALCAVARKIAVIAWHMLTKGEDYRYQAPTLTRKKLRALQVKAGVTEGRIRIAAEYEAGKIERRALETTQRAYEELVQARRVGAGATKGDAT